MATITASVAGGEWNKAAAWEGGVEPKEGDDVILAATSGTITITSGAKCRSLDATNYKATLNGGQELSIGTTTSNAGLALKLGSGMTVANETNMRFNFVSTSAEVQKITCATRKMPRFNLKKGKYQLEDKYERHVAEGANIQVEEGAEFKTNGQEVICWLVIVKGNSILSLGASKVKVEASGGSIFTVETGSTFEAGTSTVELTSAEPVNIEGPTAGLTFNVLTLAGQATLATGSITYTVATLNLNMAGSENGFRVGNGATLEITTSLTTNAKAGSILKIRSSSVGNKWKLKKTGTPIAIGEYIELRDCVAEGAVPFTTTLNDKNLGGNQNFTWPQEEYVPPPPQPPTYYSPRRRYKPFPPPALVEASAKEILETLTATQGQGVTLEKTVQRTLTLTQAQSLVKVVALARTLSATQAQSPSKAVALARSLSVTQAQSATHANALSRTLSLTQGQSVTVTASRGIVVLLTITQGQAASRAATPTRNLSVGQGASSSRTTQLGRTLAITQVTSSSVTRGLGRTLSIGQGQSAGVSSQIDRKLTIGQGQAVSRTTSVARTLAATQAQALSRAVALARSLSCGGSQAVTIASGHASGRTLAVGQAQAVSQARSVTRFLSAGQGSTPSFGRAVTRTLLAAAGQVVRRTATSARSLSASQSSTASLQVAPLRVFSMAQGATIVRATSLTHSFTVTQGQSIRVHGQLPFAPANLISSADSATVGASTVESRSGSTVGGPGASSSVEGDEMSSVEPNPRAESSVS